MDRITKIKKRHEEEFSNEYSKISKQIIDHALLLSRNKGYRYNVPGGFKLSQIMEPVGLDNTTSRRKTLERELEKRGFSKRTGTWWIPGR